MINTGDKLICTNGNYFYEESKLYTVSEFVNDKYFKLSTGNNEEHWYATIDDSGIYVSFDCLSVECENAWFETIEDKNDDWLNVYKTSNNA